MMTHTAAGLVWLAGVLGWYGIRYPFERKANKIGVRKSLFDRRETTILAFVLLCLFVLPLSYVLLGFPASLDRPFIPAIAWLGLVPLAAALWLFRQSHVVLGRNWSISLELRDQHALVKTGVYRLIRHPMYSSFFLLGIAQMLLLSNWLQDASALLGAGAFYAFRISREEKMMLECFGDDYRAYMAHTKQFIPWLI